MRNKKVRERNEKVQETEMRKCDIVRGMRKCEKEGARDMRK